MSDVSSCEVVKPNTLSHLDNLVNSKLSCYSENTIISVDGIVAAGKTTFCEMLCRRYNLPKSAFFEESFDEKLLIDYIRDPSTHATAFMRDITRRKVAVYEEAKKRQLSIIDRSYHGDLAFTCTRVAAGALTPDFAKEQEATFNAIDLTDSVVIRVFIDTRPEIALQRCRTRGRDGEELYTIEYFNQIQFYHIPCMMSSDVVLRGW